MAHVVFVDNGTAEIFDEFEKQGYVVVRSPDESTVPDESPFARSTRLLMSRAKRLKERLDKHKTKFPVIVDSTDQTVIARQKFLTEIERNTLETLAPYISRLDWYDTSTIRLEDTSATEALHQVLRLSAPI